MDIEIDGVNISSEQDFHRELEVALGVQQFYGHNLNALWDLLSASVERPVKLVWRNHDFSKREMGNVFHRIVGILEEVQLQDENFRLIDRFSYYLD